MKIAGFEDPDDYVETWKAIAGALSRSERWCRYRANKTMQDDPLPVFKIGGVVRLVKGDLDAWLARRRAEYEGTNAVCPP